MYTDIYKKIKILAWIIAIVGISLSVIFALFCIIRGIIIGLGDDAGLLLFLIGIFCGPLGAILSWVSTWTVYAFGEMVEDVHFIRRRFSIKEEDLYSFDDDMKPESPQFFE